ncbi:hypothetical protein HD806DRAFT_551271 [Xylariaceae sp. AK1471]|nr:hypothetical protein HD806DRAFT_551271 [Xylariaceae sp. AK1471]
MREEDRNASPESKSEEYRAAKCKAAKSTRENFIKSFGDDFDELENAEELGDGEDLEGAEVPAEFEGSKGPESGPQEQVEDNPTKKAKPGPDPKSCYLCRRQLGDTWYECLGCRLDPCMNCRQLYPFEHLVVFRTAEDQTPPHVWGNPGSDQHALEHGDGSDVGDGVDRSDAGDGSDSGDLSEGSPSDNDDNWMVTTQRTMRAAMKTRRKRSQTATYKKFPLLRSHGESVRRRSRTVFGFTGKCYQQCSTGFQWPNFHSRASSRTSHGRTSHDRRSRRIKDEEDKNSGDDEDCDRQTVHMLAFDFNEVFDSTSSRRTQRRQWRLKGKQRLRELKAKGWKDEHIAATLERSVGAALQQGRRQNPSQRQTNDYKSSIIPNRRSVLALCPLTPSAHQSLQLK